MIKKFDSLLKTEDSSVYLKARWSFKRLRPPNAERAFGSSMALLNSSSVKAIQRILNSTTIDSSVSYKIEANGECH